MIHTSKPRTPKLGDFFIFPQDDRRGRSSRIGGHTNYGYSGYLVIAIYDGKAWAQLTRKCQESIDIAENRFDYRHEVEFVLEQIMDRIDSFCEKHPAHTIHSWWYKNRKYAELCLSESDSGPR